MTTRLAGAITLATAILLPATAAQAADVALSGQLQAHNQVLQFDIRMVQPGSDVRIWTDSWLSGQNFDPIAALWLQQGSGFSLLAEVDDDDSVAPGQGYYDSGLQLPVLAAGHYRLTLGAAPNTAIGSLLAQGFALDSEAPIALADWNQPSHDPNANDQKGSFWRLHVSGVDQISAVPEPGSVWLLALGVAGLLAWRRLGA